MKFLLAAFAMAAGIGLGVLLGVAGAEEWFVPPHTHDPTTGQVVTPVAGGSPIATPLPATTPEPYMDITPNVTRCETVLERDGHVYLRAHARYWPVPHHFTVDDLEINVFGDLRHFVLWLEVVDQDGELLAEVRGRHSVFLGRPYVRINRIDPRYWSRWTQQYTGPLRPEHRVPPDVESITCRAGGYLEDLS